MAQASTKHSRCGVYGSESHEKLAMGSSEALNDSTSGRWNYFKVYPSLELQLNVVVLGPQGS